MSDKVPIEQLVDVEALERELGRPPSPRRLREALPAGWLLDEDGRHARRDLRVLARDGWVLLLGLVCFGSAGIYLFLDTFPHGWRGVIRIGVLGGLVVLIGGVVGPLVTRAILGKGRRPGA